MSLRFEWDPAKDAANRRKHGVSFAEASTAFYDDDAILIDDEGHSKPGEERFILLGLSNLPRVRLLVVCHCYREENEVIRIISARKATRRERDQYFNRWR